MDIPSNCIYPTTLNFACIYVYVCLCLFHTPLEPYQGIKGCSAAGNDEWLPGAEVHVVITSAKGFWPCWQGNRKG